MLAYKCVIPLLLSLCASTNAFHLPSGRSLRTRVKTTPLYMSDTELSEVDKLRAAAAKAREEYERLSKVGSNMYVDIHKHSSIT